jgi:ketosteroid isomerase-like protein
MSEPIAIREFFESYRQAFNRLDVDAIVGHFCTPATLSTNDGYTVWSDAAQVHKNITALCNLYRTLGFAGAECEPLDILEQPPRHAFANVRWTVHHREGLSPWRFRTAYNLRCEGGRWRILLCTAYEEKVTG